MDTLKLLFQPHVMPERMAELDGWKLIPYPAHGVLGVEGHPLPGGLASPSQVARAGVEIAAKLDEFCGVRGDRGVARVDLTTTRKFAASAQARALLAGMAALELPRCDTIRRGSPPHSIAWAHTAGARKLARVYDKGLERGGEPFESVRLEDQRRYGSGGRPPLDEVADPAWQREAFVRRFAPMRKAVDGVKVASLPVIAQALADEVEYGYRSMREAARLGGALVLLSGGLTPNNYERRSLYRWRQELREAGYVVAPDWLEPVEVDLAGELDRACEEFGRGA